MTQSLSNADFATLMRKKRGESPLVVGLPKMPGLTRSFVNEDGDLIFLLDRGDDIDPDRYQPPGSSGPIPVPAGKYHNLRVYLVSEDHTTVVYGPAAYDSCEEAAEAIGTEPYVEHRDLKSAALLTAITVKQGVTDLVEAQAAGDVKLMNRPPRSRSSRLSFRASKSW